MITHPTLATLPTEPSARLVAAPATIGRFQIRGEIGRGSNGVVYAAHDPVLGREVAIKAIPLTDDEYFRRQVEANFLNEAKAAAGVNHPNIVTVFDAGKSDQLAYIAMERLHGRDLHDFLVSGQRLGYRQIANLMARVADAVHYAHKRGLVHRDIKPSNIFLLRDMKPKVLDFGVAMAAANDPTATHKRQLIGTPNYMSPEQALGRRLDARSDVFSLGTILYELICGRRAFEGKTIEETLAQVISDPPLPVDHGRADAPAALKDIVERALDKDVERRYQTAGELRNALVAFAEPANASTNGGRTLGGAGTASLVRQLRANPAAALAAGAAALAALLVLAFTLSRPDQQAAEAPAPAAAPPVTVTTPSATGSTAADGARTAAPQSPSDGGESSSAVEPGSTSPRGRAAAETRRVPRADSVAPPAPAGDGFVALGIAPWGEVLINGHSRGVSPPLTRLALPPGVYDVEVRNNVAPPFRARVEIKSGQTLSLQHRF
jgi:hypothetical protein